jgi:hypothetical protein
MINAPLEDARIAAERLRVMPGLAAVTRRCSNCDESRPALGFSLQDVALEQDRVQQ